MDGRKKRGKDSYSPIFSMTEGDEVEIFWAGLELLRFLLVVSLYIKALLFLY